ncbi:hypothetical protein Tco_0586902 [Tanacetum coccineum]
MLFSKKGCRIAIGWNANNVKCSMAHNSGQSMLYHIEILSSQQAFFCTFIYAANKGKERREMWKDLSLYNKIVRGFNMGNYGRCKFNAIFLAYGISDHSPAILTIPQVMKKKNNSVRMVNYITDKMEFKDLAVEKWKMEVQGHAMFKMVKKLKTLKPHLNKLNWKHGNLFDKVATLKKKLHVIQAKIDKDPSNKSLRLEGVQVLSEYKEATSDEEKLLRQKAKITWLKEGDKNSAYFQKVLKGRMNRSRIMFFGISPEVDKFSKDDSMLFEKKVSSEEADFMIREISNDEIKRHYLILKTIKLQGLMDLHLASLKIMGDHKR